MDGPDGCIDDDAPFAEEAGVLTPFVAGTEEPDDEEDPADPGCLVF